MFFEYDNVYQLNIVYNNYKITKKINKPLKICNEQNKQKYDICSNCYDVLFHCTVYNGKTIRTFEPFIICRNDNVGIIFSYEEEKSEWLTEKYIKIYRNRWLIYRKSDNHLVENRVGKDFILLNNQFFISKSGILYPFKLPDHLYDFVCQLHTNNNKDYFLIYDPIYKITRAFGEFNKNHAKYLSNSTKSKLLFCLWIFSHKLENIPLSYYIPKPLIEKYIFPIFAQL